MIKPIVTTMLLFWFLFLLLVSISIIFNGYQYFLSGFSLVISGLFLIEPFKRFLENKYNINLKSPISIFITVFFLFLSFIFYPHGLPEATEAGFKNVSSYRDAKERGFKTYSQLQNAKKNGFNTYKELTEAVAKGFSTASEYKLALEKGFDNFEDFYKAKNLGLNTHDEWLAYKAKAAGFDEYSQYLEAQSLGFETKREYIVATKNGWKNKEQWEKGKSLGFSDKKEFDKALDLGFASKKVYDEALKKGFKNYENYYNAKKYGVESPKEWNDIKYIVNKRGLTLDAYFELKRKKQNCIHPDYKKLARNIESYYGECLKFKGKIFQVKEQDDGTTLAMFNYTYEGYGFWNDIVVALVPSEVKDKRLLDGDIVTVWGTVDYPITYTALLGNEITAPAVFVIDYSIH